MSWWDTFIQTIKDFFDWLSDEKTKEQLENIANLVFTIITVVGKFNDEPGNETKREYVRGVLRFFKYASVEDLEKALELKKTGALDGLESYDMDALLGVTTAQYIKDKKEKKKVGKTS